MDIGTDKVQGMLRADTTEIASMDMIIDTNGYKARATAQKSSVWVRAKT